MEAPETPDAAEQRLFAEAFDGGRFNDALGHLTKGLARQLYAMLKQEGHVVGWHEPPDSTFSFYAGLAVALQKLLREEGDDASYKLVIARDLTAGLAELKELLGTPLGDNQVDGLARVLIQAIRIGAWMDQLGLATSGLLDELGELKWRAEMLKEKQRRAAEQTNAKWLAFREAALEQAVMIVAEHPDVTADDLLVTLREALPGKKLPISQLSRCVQEWVRDGQLPKLPK